MRQALFGHKNGTKKDIFIGRNHYFNGLQTCLWGKKLFKISIIWHLTKAREAFKCSFGDQFLAVSWVADCGIHTPPPLQITENCLQKGLKMVFLEQKGLKWTRKGVNEQKSAKVYLKKYFVFKQFWIREYHPTLVCGHNIFWKERHRFLGFRTFLFKQQMFLKGKSDQRFPMWSFLVTKRLQAPMFWWPKVWRVVQVPRCPNPAPHVRPLGRLRQRHSGLNVTRVLYGIA